MTANWSVFCASIEHKTRDDTQSLNWYQTLGKDQTIRIRQKSSELFVAVWQPATGYFSPRKGSKYPKRLHKQNLVATLLLVILLIIQFQ